jgi:hypothetical protein
MLPEATAPVSALDSSTPQASATTPLPALSEDGEQNATGIPEGPDFPTQVPTEHVGEWLPPFPPGPVTITLIDMITADQGWAVGGDADPGNRVLVTEDGGVSWRDVSPPQPDAAGMLPFPAFLDADTAFVTYSPADPFTMPDYIPVWFTDDGGGSWTRVGAINELIGEGVWFPQFLEFVDAQHGWFLVNVGAGMSHQYVVLYGTVDGGASWEVLVNPFDDISIQLCSKTAMQFANPDFGFLTFDCGGVTATTIGVTEDGGRTWLLSLPLADVLELDGFDVVNDTYCLTDALTLTPGPFPDIDVRMRLTCKHFADDVLTEREFIISSADGGANWSIAPYPGGVLLAAGNVIYALGKENHIADTTTLDFTLAGTMIWDGQFDVVNESWLFAVARYENEIALVYSNNGASDWAIITAVVIE